MKNKLLKINIVFSLVLVFFIKICTLSAVISDNDGAAFITKSEFEALKKDFATQIGNYNSSIDNKIDGAIAAYLAGAAKKTETIECNVTALEWPIMVIDKLKVIENVTKGTTTSPDQETLWNMSYSMVGVGSRGSLWYGIQTAVGSFPNYKGSHINTSMEKMENTHVDKIKKYLNGVRSGTDNFKVSNLCVEPALKFQTGFLVENLQSFKSVADPQAGYNTDTNMGVYSMIALDQSKIVNHTIGGAGTNSLRNSVTDNYGSLWHTKDFAYGAKSPYINLIHLANSVGSISTGTYATTQNKYSYLDHPGDAVWEGLSGIGNFTGETMWSKEYTYSNASLDRVYNYSDSTKTTHFAPVTYDNDLYFTNKKANRQYIPPSNRINWEGRSVRNDNPFGILGVITAGENLETESENSSGTRSWYNKSLISQSRLIYDFKDENGKTYTDHRMTNGIPIYVVTSNSDVTDVKITLNIKSQTGYTSNQKFAIFSKKPITTQKYSDNVEGNADYIKIKNSKPTLNLRKTTLNEGNNVLEIGDMYIGEVLYVKILWNDTNEEYITLSKPSITYTPD